MKKTIATLSIIMLSFAANAQDAAVNSSTDVNSYDKWSIELGAGVNKPFRTLTSGYFTSTPSFWNADLGVRYMFNPKFGLKLDFGYNKFQEDDDSSKFDTNYWRTDLQGVVNLGRVLNFETWTNTIGLLAHGGVGVSMMTSDGFNGTDYMANGIIGLTGQVKLSNSIVLTGDISGITNGKQNHNFDGMSAANTGFFDGGILNGSVGLTFYLGKNEKHADWVAEADKYNNLDNRLTQLETGLIDSDKDGVADMYDLEPNTVSGVAVNTKGQSIDNNKNGVPDELESYLSDKFGQNNTTTSGTTVEQLINDGYVNVYFDFNSSKPTNSSLAGVDFLVKYLKNNPSASAQVIGYADEIGNSDYNQKLSTKRAETVKTIITNSGINASRLSVVGNGEDASVNKNSATARQIVRRVTFKVKN